MAISGEAVGLYFEEKLQEMFPGQSFPERPETEDTPDTKEKEEDDTDDSEEDLQPRRKRLKTEEKVVHIKWELSLKEQEKWKTVFLTSHTFLLFDAANKKDEIRCTNCLVYLILAFERITVRYIRHLPSSELSKTET